MENDFLAPELFYEDVVVRQTYMPRLFIVPLNACLGLLPSHPSSVVYPAVPPPILLPTTAATMAPPPVTMMPTQSPAPPPTQPITNRPAGQLAIDPRLGTTPRAPASFQAPQITAYRGEIPNFNMAVKFPRNRRNINGAQLTKSYFLEAAHNDRHMIRKRQTQSCTCVPNGTCNGVMVVNNVNYGSGLIDFRIVTPGGGQCPAGLVYCCTNTNTPPSTPIGCGTLQSVPATTVQPSTGQANFGEYPWQALILTNQNDYIAGGVLIDQMNVLTVTHRMQPYLVGATAPNVKVRLGEWDAAGAYEPVPFQEYSVAKTFSHPSYSPGTLQYDITVLRLSSPVPISPMAGAATSINRACLPPSAASVYTGQRCWVSGWGKNMFGLQGQFQQILKEVDVPIVDPSTCQNQLRNARLGVSFVLDTTSFICAGGEANKDACTGDGGSGLVCLVNGQWVVVGLVAWGLGCAAAGTPAVYVNVAALLPWIQQQVATP